MSIGCIVSPSKINRDRKYSSAKRRRTVPGPAGLLPNVSQSARSRSSWPSDSAGISFCQDQSSGHDQSVVSLEKCDLWRRIAENCGPEVWSIISTFNIGHICEIAPKEGFPRGKIPVLCAALDKIDALFSDAKAVLRDKTGFIGCTIDRSVIKRYRKYLSTGAILLLKQASLFSRNGKTFYLNITKSNLVRLYLDDDHCSIDQSNASSVLLLRSFQIQSSPSPFSAAELQDMVEACLAPPVIPPNKPIAKPNRKPSAEGDLDVRCSPSNEANSRQFKSPISSVTTTFKSPSNSNIRLSTDSLNKLPSPLSATRTPCAFRGSNFPTLLQSSPLHPKDFLQPKMNFSDPESSLNPLFLPTLDDDVLNNLDDCSQALAEFLSDDLEDLFASVLE